VNRREFLTAGLGTGALGVVTGCVGVLDEERAATDTTVRTDGRQQTPATTTRRTTTMSTPTPTETTTEPTPTPQPAPTQLYGLTGSTGLPDENPGYFERKFTQTVRGTRTDFTTRLPEGLFQYYDARARTPNYGAYVSDTFDDPFIQDIADTFERFRKRRNQSSRAMVDHAIAFVQGMRYTSDVNEPYNEYPKYPVETLKDRGGDCEDTCILLASILRKLGYGVVLLEIPSKRHMALGLKGDESIPGSYVTYRGSRYYYVETTGEGWRVGQAPDEYQGVQTEIRSVNDHPSHTLGWGTAPGDDGRVRVRTVLYNAGMAPARNARVKVRVRAKGRDRPVAGADTDRMVVGAVQKSEDTVQVEAPADRTLKLRFVVTLNGETHDITESEWRKPQ
jgi:hypothetical protein